MASKGAPDRTPPKLSLTSPAGGSATFDTTPRLAGRAGHATGDRRAVAVRVYLGAKATGRPQRVLTARRRGAAWAVNLVPALAAGHLHRQGQPARRLAATAAPSRASTFTIRRAPVVKPPVKVTPPPGKPVTPPVKPPQPPVIPAPTAAIVSPAAGAETADPTPTFAAQASDAGAQPSAVTLAIYPGAAAAGAPTRTLELTQANGTWSGTPAEPLDDGVYTAQVEALGASGKTGRSAAVTFSVDTVAPQPSLTAPAEGAATSDSTPAFSGSAGAAAGDSTQVRVYRLRRSERLRHAGGQPHREPLGRGLLRVRGRRAPGGHLHGARRAAGRRGQHRPERAAHLRGHVDRRGRHLSRHRDGRRPARLLAAGRGRAAPRPPTRPASPTRAPTRARPRSARPASCRWRRARPMALDGTDDSVRVPSSASLSPTAALSLETWIRPATLPTSTATLMRKDLQYLLRLGSGGAVTLPALARRRHERAHDPGRRGSAPARWSHVVATFDGVSMAIYVNGTVRATLAMTAHRGHRDRRAHRSAPAARPTGSAGGWTRWPCTAAALPGPRVLAHYTKSSPVEDPPPTVVLESPAPGSTVDLRPVFAGTADGETSHRDGQGLLGRLGLRQPRPDALRRPPVEQPLLRGSLRRT